MESKSVKEKVAAIVLNGDQYFGDIVGDIIIGVDGGYNKTLKVDVFVGDKDSVQGNIAAKEQILLNVDKDATDGEVAVRYALEQRFDRINFYGVTGGRLDHILANLGIMALAVQKGVKVAAYGNDCDIYMTKDLLELQLPKNILISLSPIGDSAHIISLEGVKWELNDQIILRNSSRTVSNLTVSEKIRLCVDFGIVALIVNK